VALGHNPAKPTTLLLPIEGKGRETDAKSKNAKGYASVILPPAGTEVVGLKASVTGTCALKATLSDKATWNDTLDTCVKMPPESTAAESRMS
jgi:hypothetical protein